MSLGVAEVPGLNELGGTATLEDLQYGSLLVTKGCVSSSACLEGEILAISEHANEAESRIESLD